MAIYYSNILITIQNQIRALEFLKHHEFGLVKEMHLHGPYMCQYGILLNYRPFRKYSDLIQFKYAEAVSVRKAAKLIFEERIRRSVDKVGMHNSNGA